MNYFFPNDETKINKRNTQLQQKQGEAIATRTTTVEELEALVNELETEFKTLVSDKEE